MSFRCRCIDGVTRDISWQNVKNAWISAVTVCAASLYQRPVSEVVNVSNIYVFINDGYVDYQAELEGDDSGSEANNLILTLESQDFTVNTFTDISSANVVIDTLNNAGANGVVLIPELESEANDEDEEGGILNDDLTTFSKVAISTWVDGGGSLVMFFPEAGSTVDTLNSIFGFSIELSDFDTPISLVDDSSIFADAPSTISANDATCAIITTTLPEDSVAIYSGSGDNQSIVTLIPYGSGSIFILGWDWYDASPQGSQDGGWLEVLRLFIASKTS